MAAIALLHSHAGDVLASHLALPSYKPFSFDRVLSQLRNPSRFKPLGSQYKDIVSKLPYFEITVIEGDAKKGNRIGVSRGVKIIDLESLCLGPQPINFALPFVQRSISREEWPIFLETYRDVRAQETGLYHCDVQQLAEQVREVGPVPCLMELSGIHSRPMGYEEKKQAQILEEFICSY